MKKIIFILLLLLSTQVQAFVRFSQDYSILRAWFDDDNIYVFYKKNKYSALLIPFVMHGEITISDKNTYFLYQLAKVNISSTKTTIDLDDGEPVDIEFVYKDKDFTIINNKSNIAVIRSKNKVNTLKDCKHHWASYGIRIRGKLFYCGVLFNQSGEIEVKIPEEIIGQVQDEFKATLDPSRRWEYIPITYAILNDEIFLTSNKIFGKTSIALNNSQLKFGAWSLSKNEKLSWHEVPLSIKSEFNSIANEIHIYSPAGFVLESKSKNIAALCQENKCNQIPILENKMRDYLIVDNEKHQLIKLKLENDSTLRIFLMPYGE